MKEIVIIPKEHIEYEQILGAGFDTIRFHLGTDKTLDVPETFEELKELCKDLKGNKKDCGGAMWFEFGCLNNDKMYLGKFLCVDEKGQVGIAERSWGGDISITIFAQNRTPQQMWQIIKNLIGEE